MNVSNKTKRPYLSINLTGMDDTKKENLRYAWIDLHKENPSLSQALFNYSFFRAGIGFSPKTFMALVPSYVKERLQSEDGRASYIDTYRKFPKVVPELVIEQFIRNNWDNNKLVPWRGGKDAKYNIDIKHGILTTADASEVNDLKNLSYIKTKAKGITYLWKFKASDDRSVIFERVKPLGNNGEYLEMGLDKIDNPLSETLQVSQGNDASELKSKASQESTAEAPVSPVISNTEAVKNVAALADLIQKQVPKLSRQQALDRVEDIRQKGPKLYAKFLQNVFRQAGLELNIEETINEYKKYC